MFGTNCTTPLSSVVVKTSRALALSSKDSSMAHVMSTREPEVEAMAVIFVCTTNWLAGVDNY